MSRTPSLAAIPSSSNIKSIFDTALKSYQKKTKQDLKNHDLFKQLEKCDSPGAILDAFQADQCGPSRTGGGDDRLKQWFVPTVNVLYAFSATLGEGVGLIFSPAKVVFAGVGVLLLAAKGVAASQDTLVDVLGRINGFFSRLEIYTGVPLTPAMTEKMVEITIEVLGILATATKEMKESRAKKFVKRVAGRTDLEDGLKKLDKLTLEEVAMASAQLLKVTHDIRNELTVVAGGVEGVGQKVQVVVTQVEDVQCGVQIVRDQVEVVDKRVQLIVDDGKGAMATATEAKFIVQQTADDVDDVKRNQLRESLRGWQSPPDPSTSHNFASDRQHEGTAEWFINDGKFGEWKVNGSLLWIHGKPGSGKSVLCSAIINDITTQCNEGSTSMAYFYFDFRDINKQARHNLLSSLLTQLSDRSERFCDIFYRLYKTHDNGARQPSDSTLFQCLKEMLTLSNQGPVYLITDALDECPDTSDVPSPREQVLDLVKDLVGLRIPSLHICITSRPEVDIGDVLESIASQTVSLQDESGQKKDIADYVRSVVYSGSGKFMRRWRLEDKEYVIEILSERADGMFRWVFCQLETLRNCLPQNVRSVLKALPKSLDETYERMLKEIGKANPHQAYRLLQCLTVATRPLRVEELAEVLALDFDGAEDGIPALNRDWRWDDEQQGVLSTCSSLIVVVDSVDDEDRPSRSGARKYRVVQFAHFSVKEFLTSDRLANLEADISHFHIRLEPAHTVIAQACLAILLQSDYNDRAKSSSPLGDYAGRHWVDHAQFENVSLRVEDGMRRLFNPAKPYFATWVNWSSHNIDKQWWSFLRGSTGFDTLSYYYSLLWKPVSSAGVYDQRDQENYTPLCLYYASLCGFSNLTKYLIAEYPQHANATVGYNKSPLVAALKNRHWHVAELLYRSGAATDVTVYKNRTPLHAASEEGIVDVARWLLGHGADANSQEDDNTTPLHLAAANGHLELVRILLGHSVDVNAATKDDRTPLHKAAEGGHVDVARLLIQHGADADTHLQMLLILASSSKSVETVQLFVELGADVNAQDVGYSTPLNVASSKGDAETVQLLIKLGVDVNAQDKSYSMPLHLASSRTRSSTKTLQLLIKRGADVNARDGNHSTPLHLASSKRNTEIAQLLIENGADVNAYNDSHQTPLHLTLSANNNRWMSLSDQRVMELLIEHGADVNAQDRSHTTPLHLASSMGDAKIMRLVIEHGADVNARDQTHSTPLHLALSIGDAKPIGLLLQYGADVHALDRNHSTPLHLASYRGNAEAVQLMIEHGANVNARDGDHKTPLLLALYEDDFVGLSARSVQLLLGHGADVNAHDGSYSMPLHLASSGGDAESVRLMIEHGADVNARDQAHSTPLHLASSKGNAETVELLLKRGADVHAQDQDHSTPLHLASSQDGRHSTGFDPASSGGSAETVRLLLQHGANVHALDEKHAMPLHLASSKGNAEIVKVLLQHGADLHAQDRNHWTPLHLASLTWNTETMRLLIEHEADVNARCLAHLTPLHLASYRGNSETVELLLQHGADVHARDRDQSTPLHVASCCGNIEPVQRLIQHGADVNAHNYSHSTPLHLALQVELSGQVPMANVKANVQVVSLLLEHGANVDVEDDEGRTPFQIASSMGQSEITQMISDYCAIVE